MAIDRDLWFAAYEARSDSCGCIQRSYKSIAADCYKIFLETCEISKVAYKILGRLRIDGTYSVNCRILAKLLWYLLRSFGQRLTSEERSTKLKIILRDLTTGRGVLSYQSHSIADDSLVDLQCVAHQLNLSKVLAVS